MDIGIDRSIAERTEKQFGLISRDQLRDVGATRAQWLRRVRTGRLVPVGDNVFRIGGAPTSWEQSVLAACLDVDGVASHRTAAALHRLDGFRRQRVPIEVTVLEGRRSKHTDLAVVHTTTTLDPIEDVVRVEGIPATTIARTFLGLAAHVPAVPIDRLAASIGVAVRDGQASDAWLWWMLERRRRSGRNGVVALEDILLDRAGLGRTESWLERETLAVIAAHGLPIPVCQRRVKRRGAFVARVDFCYEAERLIVEVDGHGSHSTKEQRAADAERANRLILAGYRVLRFTYDDVVHRPGLVARMISEALRQTAALAS